MTNEEIKARMREAYEAGYRENESFQLDYEGYEDMMRKSFDAWLAKNLPALLEADPAQVIQAEVCAPTVSSETEDLYITWLREEGESVVYDEVIAEIESDKATFEITAERAGKLNRLVPDGKIKQGQLIAYINKLRE